MTLNININEFDAAENKKTFLVNLIEQAILDEVVRDDVVKYAGLIIEAENDRALKLLYREFSLKFHPDKGGSEEIFKFLLELRSLKLRDLQVGSEADPEVIVRNLKQAATLTELKATYQSSLNNLLENRDSSKDEIEVSEWEIKTISDACVERRGAIIESIKSMTRKEIKDLGENHPEKEKENLYKFLRAIFTELFSYYREEHVPLLELQKNKQSIFKLEFSKDISKSDQTIFMRAVHFIIFNIFPADERLLNKFDLASLRLDLWVLPELKEENLKEIELEAKAFKEEYQSILDLAFDNPIPFRKNIQLEISKIRCDFQFVTRQDMQDFASKMGLDIEENDSNSISFHSDQISEELKVKDENKRAKNAQAEKLLHEIIEKIEDGKTKIDEIKKLIESNDILKCNVRLFVDVIKTITDLNNRLTILDAFVIKQDEVVSDSPDEISDNQLIDDKLKLGLQFPENVTLFDLLTDGLQSQTPEYIEKLILKLQPSKETLVNFLFRIYCAETKKIGYVKLAEKVKEVLKGKGVDFEQGTPEKYKGFFDRIKAYLKEPEQALDEDEDQGVGLNQTSPVGKPVIAESDAGLGGEAVGLTANPNLDGDLLRGIPEVVVVEPQNSKPKRSVPLIDLTSITGGATPTRTTTPTHHATTRTITPTHHTTTRFTPRKSSRDTQGSQTPRASRSISADLEDALVHFKEGEITPLTHILMHFSLKKEAQFLNNIMNGTIKDINEVNKVFSQYKFWYLGSFLKEIGFDLSEPKIKSGDIDYLDKAKKVIQDAADAVYKKFKTEEELSNGLIKFTLETYLKIPKWNHEIFEFVLRYQDWIEEPQKKLFLNKALEQFLVFDIKNRNLHRHFLIQIIDDFSIEETFEFGVNEAADQNILGPNLFVFNKKEKDMFHYAVKLQDAVLFGNLISKIGFENDDAIVAAIYRLVNEVLRQHQVDLVFLDVVQNFMGQFFNALQDKKKLIKIFDHLLVEKNSEIVGELLEEYLRLPEEDSEIKQIVCVGLLKKLNKSLYLPAPRAFAGYSDEFKAFLERHALQFVQKISQRTEELMLLAFQTQNLDIINALIAKESFPEVLNLDQKEKKMLDYLAILADADDVMLRNLLTEQIMQLLNELPTNNARNLQLFIDAGDVKIIKLALQRGCSPVSNLACGLKPVQYALRKRGLPGKDSELKNERKLEVAEFLLLQLTEDEFETQIESLLRFRAEYIANPEELKKYVIQIRQQNSQQDSQPNQSQPTADDINKYKSWEVKSKEKIKIPNPNDVQDPVSEKLIEMVLLKPKDVVECVFEAQHHQNGRGVKMRVVEGVYNDKNDIENTLKNILLKAAHGKIDQKEFGLMVKYAKDNGGFASKFFDDEGEGYYEDNTEHLKTFLREEFQTEDQDKKAQNARVRKWLKFSYDVQQASKSAGIFTGRENDVQMVGLRSAFALVLVGDKLDFSKSPEDVESEIEAKKTSFRQKFAAPEQPMSR